MIARFRLVGLMVFALFAIFAVMSSSASALQWLLDGKPIEGTVHIASTGSLELADLAATGGSTAIICEGTGAGSIGPLAHDEVTELKAAKCKFVSGKNGACEASKEVTARPVNLPYLTLLVTISGETFDEVLPKGGTTIGWTVECTVLGVFRVSDTCTAASTLTLVVNLPGGVDTNFLERETASCTEGNSSSGMVIGTPLNANPTGHTISVSNSPNQ